MPISFVCVFLYRKMHWDVPISFEGVLPNRFLYMSKVMQLLFRVDVQELHDFQSCGTVKLG
jgi:hypothetical protein